MHHGDSRTAAPPQVQCMQSEVEGTGRRPAAADRQESDMSKCEDWLRSVDECKSDSVAVS
jgi:hypothetical protein